MKINVNNKTKMIDAINEVETGCRARLLFAGNIIDSVEKAEAKLDSMSIPKKYWTGCRIEFSPDRVSHSYRGIAEGTYATVERCATGWFLVSVRRGATGAYRYGSSASAKLHLSNEAKEYMPTSFAV